MRISRKAEMPGGDSRVVQDPGPCWLPPSGNGPSPEPPEGPELAPGASGADYAAGSLGTVSLQAQLPEALIQSMRRFIDQHPSWDQYRLVQAALAGFLVQNGVQSRALTRCYLANLFPGQGGFRSP